MASLIHAQGIPASTLALKYNDSLPGTLSFTAPHAAYTFFGGQGDLVTVEVSPLASGIDPKVTLLDVSGQVLMQNDNGAFTGKPDSFLSLFIPQTGFYTVIVESSNGTTGDFLIHLSGRTPVKSHRLEFGVPVEVDVRTDPLPVYFTFKANTDCPTTLTVYNISDGEPYTFPFTVIVRDEDGTPVEQLQGGRMTENRMTVHNEPDTSPTAGLYEVEVSSANPAVAGSLFLVITCADQEPACFVPPGLTGTPTPPPPTYDPCELGEIVINRPEGPVVISGQEGGAPSAKLVPDQGSGQVQMLGEASLTPSPTLPAPVVISPTPETPCTPTPTPPCLSPLEALQTEFAPTVAALEATLVAGDATQKADVLTKVAVEVAPTVWVKATAIAGQPDPCATPTVPPCLSPLDSLETEIAPTIAAIQATINAGGLSANEIQATHDAFATEVLGKATQAASAPNPCEPASPTPQIPTLTPCPTNDRTGVVTAREATQIAQTLVAAGCATPTPDCPPPDRNLIQVVEDATSTAVAYALDCGTPHPTRTRTPTPTATCTPIPGTVALPCATPHPTRTPTPAPDCTPVAATVAGVPCQPVPSRTPDCGTALTGAVIPCEPTLTPVPDCTPVAATVALVPCATATCSPSPAGAVIPCNPTPTPDCTPARNLIAGAVPCQSPSTPTCPPPGTPDRTRLSDALNPCANANGCPTPGAGDATTGIAASGSDQGLVRSNDLGILITAVPCIPLPTATPTSGHIQTIPQVDCSGFALTSPTDGLPNGGVTVYWNPAAGANAYRVNVYNDANQLKLSVTVPGNQTSVGIDVSEGSIGPGYTFTLQVQAIFGKPGCTSSKTENRAASTNRGGNDDDGDKPKPTCKPATVGVPSC